MKKLKFSTLIFILGFGFTGLAFAQDAPAPEARPTVSPNLGGLNGQQISDNTAEGVNKGGDEIRDVVFEDAYENGGADAQKALDQAIDRIGNAAKTLQVSDLDVAYQTLEIAAKSCENYTTVGVTCCENPKQCGGSEESAAAKTDQVANQTAQQAQQATAGAGTGGAAAQCLSALPGLMALTAKSKGTGQACKLIKDGNGQKKLGCSETCEHAADLGDIFRELASKIASQRANANDMQGSMNAQLLAQKSFAQINLAKKSKKTCESKTIAGTQAANAQAGSGTQAIMGLMGCLQALMSGDKTKEEGADDEENEPDPLVAVNCSNIAERSANPGECIGYTGGDGFGDGNLSKTSGSDLSILGGDPSSDLPDAIVDDEKDAVNGTPAAAGQGGESLKAGGGPLMATLSGGAGAGGSGDANRKTGGKAKEKDLIGGYKSVKGGSGGGYRGPASKPFKPFKFGKEKTVKDKKALAAMSKLMKAGISPDQTGSIFERATKRFAASSAKEKLFDARRNRSLWMEKRK